MKLSSALVGAVGELAVTFELIIVLEHPGQSSAHVRMTVLMLLRLLKIWGINSTL